MARLWHTLAGSFLIGIVLFPMWLAYVVPWLRMRRFGAVIPGGRLGEEHARHAPRFYWLATRMRGGLIKVGPARPRRAGAARRVVPS